MEDYNHHSSNLNDDAKRVQRWSLGFQHNKKIYSYGETPSLELRF